jgi:hypothetical protein
VLIDEIMEKKSGDIDGIFEQTNLKREARRSKGEKADGFVETYDNLVEEIKVVHLKNGVSLADNKVIGYDIARILRGGVFKVGSPTFTKPFVVVQAILVLTATLIAMGACLLLEKMEHFKIGDGALVATQTSITLVHSYFGGFLGFLFGYFVFDSLGSCNATKGQMGSFLGGIINIMLLSHDWCPGVDGEDLLIKQTSLRWAMASYSMMVKIVLCEIV